MRPILILSFLTLVACGDQKLGTFNTAPAVSITSPPDGSEVNEGTIVDFSGLVSDSGTDVTALALRWSSDIDGVLSDVETADSTGLVLYSTGSLTDGNHAITLTATDDLAESSEYTIGLVVIDLPDAPTIDIVHPMAGETGLDTEMFSFVVSVGDEQQAPETLVVSLESNLDGVFCTPPVDTLGVATCRQMLTAGDHSLRFTVTDEDGLVGIAEYLFVVERADGDFDGQDEDQGDCDDDDPNTYTGAQEICDGHDNDCDGDLDEGTDCYDDDGDGLAETAGDCNDASAISYPGAPEIEDGIDNDCDGVVDEETNSYDDDGDGYSENAGDCDDGTGAVSPAVTETCDGRDDDCDGTVDETDASGCTTYYYDYDGDGYGSSAVAGVCMCTYSGYYSSAYDTDCYDYNSAASPAASSYSTSHRGDSSFDWNCDGSESKYWTSSGGCGSWPGCSASSGWSSSTPSCGNSGSYVYSCSVDWFSCEEDTSTYTQKCI